MSKIKIENDGITTRIYVDGKEVENCVSFNLSQSVLEYPKLTIKQKDNWFDNK